LYAIHNLPAGYVDRLNMAQHPKFCHPRLEYPFLQSCRAALSQY